MGSLFACSGRQLRADHDPALIAGIHRDPSAGEKSLVRRQSNVASAGAHGTAVQAARKMSMLFQSLFSLAAH